MAFIPKSIDIIFKRIYKNCKNIIITIQFQKFFKINFRVLIIDLNTFSFSKITITKNILYKNVAIMLAVLSVKNHFASVI